MTDRLRTTKIYSQEVRALRVKDFLLSATYTILISFARRKRWTPRKPSKSEAAVSDQTEACKLSKTVMKSRLPSEQLKRSTITDQRSSRMAGQGENQEKRLTMPLQPETPSPFLPEPATNGRLQATKRKVSAIGLDELKA